MNIQNDSIEDEDRHYVNISVTFNIKHDSKPLSFLSKELSLTPTELQVCGEKFLNFKGRPVVAQSHMWRINTERLVHSIKISDHLAYLVDLLKPRQQILDKYIRDPNFQTSFAIWWQCSYDVASFGLDTSLLLDASSLCNEFHWQFLYDEYLSPEEERDKVVLPFE